MPAPTDPLLDRALQLMDELRERCMADALGAAPEDLLIDGYAAALALEGARRRMRAQALELSQHELALATQERELRGLLAVLRERIAQASRGPSHLLPRSGDEAAAQRPH
jgi:hypothetical protein